MERKIPFIEDEYYHLYTRGIDKKIVFETKNDYDRFMALLLLCNSADSVKFANVIRKYRGEPSLKMFEMEKSTKRLVDIVAYALMPNHLHLLVHENQAGGISKFMLKLMTAYSMFFNTKYQRSGALFTRPFRSRHINSDEYLRWVFAYILLNPLELSAHDWKEKGIKDSVRAGHHLQTYPYSSYHDYFLGERPESHILAKDTLPFDSDSLRTLDELLACLSSNDHADAF